MNYNKLKYFYEIAKIKNISHAAELLFVSQSSLSKAVSDLEEDLDVRLFIRTNRNLILTDAGQILFDRIAPFFSEEEKIRRAVYEAGHSSSDRQPEELRVGFMNFEATCEFPLFSKEFSRRHPHVFLHPSRLNKRALFSELKKDRLDAGIAIFTGDEASPDFQYKQFAEYHFAVIMRTDHPLAGRPVLTLKELTQEPFLMHGTPENSNEYHYLLSWCNRNHFDPQIIAAFDYVETLLMMVQSGLGITLLSDAAPFKNLKNLSCVPVENSPVLFGGIFYKDRIKTCALDFFIDEFCKSAGEKI